uniref:Peptidase S54 rhomboid domain-containing protein n=1 Tax=Globisporangium ultimum (strain ATCC 200006 / CBS 805.95 / DAOM BR144) TaxID=431595 RepID=K3W832_GLOUD
MGAIGGGVAVTSAMRWQQRQCADNHADTHAYRDEDEDSWSGFFWSSFADIKRTLAKELEDDNTKVLAGIIAANTAIFGLWRVSFSNPSMQRFMWRHFACSYTAIAHGKRVHTLLTSAFSHITFPHFGINMFMLWEFGRHILAPANNRNDAWYSRAIAQSKVVDYFRNPKSASQRLQLDKFMVLYLSSAVASSALSIVVSNLRGTPGVFTIGASGAVMGIFTVYCLLFPERELMLYGLVDITAAQALQLTTAMNLVGSVFQRNLAIDCVGHIGGQSTGLVLNQTAALV